MPPDLAPRQAPLPLVDTHAHLTSDRFLDDLPAVLARARSAGLLAIVTAGTTAQDSIRTVQLAHAHPEVHPAVAIHPNDVAEAQPGDWEMIQQLAADPRVVAIGETGLDRYWKRTPFERQQQVFNDHLDLAAHCRLPVIIHCRDCYPDVIRCLLSRPAPTRGVLHSFSGTREDAEELLALGLHISFAGPLTFTNRTLDSLREVAAHLPDDRLLVETDSPYLTPHPHRGKRNEPAYVSLTAQTLAQLRDLHPAELAQITTRNANTLFALNLPNPTD